MWKNLAFSAGIGLGIAAGSLGGDPPEAPKAIRDRVLESAAKYREWHRVDNEAHWSPFLCRRPEPPTARFSEADGKEAHAQKLYSMFAKDRKSYVSMKAGEPVAAGQVIVKQAWTPEEIKDEGQPLRPIRETINTRDAAGRPIQIHDEFLPYARKDGKLFKAGAAAELFVMIKSPTKTPGTDEGWTYAIVSSDGGKLLSAGVIEACKNCHEKAPFDRLFGPVQRISANP